MKIKKDETALKIGQALRNYFDAQGLEQQDVADKLGISQAAVSARLCGIKPFGKNAAKKWHEAYGFSPVFLITGAGSLFDNAPTISQTISENHGVAIQQAGPSSSAQTGGSSDGYFASLCRDLMQKIMERDAEICCLKERIKALENNPKE